MLMLRLLLPGLTAICLVAAACGGGSDNSSGTTDQQRALSSAMSFIGDDPSNLPPIGRQYDCVINIIHQPPSPQPTLKAVHGTCKWDVAPQGDSWLVDFEETWFCSDFAAKAPGFPDCDSVTGQHSWQYLVNLRDQTVDTLSDRGQYAPDM